MVLAPPKTTLFAGFRAPCVNVLGAVAWTAGEGKSDAAIFPRETLAAGLLRGLLKPWAAEVGRDLLWCGRRRQWRAAVSSPLHRWVQRGSYRSGLRQGLADG